MARKTLKKPTLSPLDKRYKPELWLETNIGTRRVSIYFAQGFGSGGLMCEDGNQGAIILIHRSYATKPQMLLDTLIHELTHVVELVYFQHTATPFGYAIPDDCNPAVQSVGTGLAQAFSELEPAKGTKLKLYQQLGLLD